MSTVFPPPMEPMPADSESTEKFITSGIGAIIPRICSATSLEDLFLSSTSTSANVKVATWVPPSLKSVANPPLSSEPADMEISFISGTCSFTSV
ncbi:MAG: hypothetical protein BWY89_01467 [Bacteroidetes bacterium ADurb.BinA012]|nr:MAG: hypothetical protein BWY89_01467 [Bacteroidetes bacterium ADurb.BinA012]